MDFTFSEEQEALRSTARAFLDREVGADHVRAMLDDERGFTDDLWRRIAELGWTGVLVPEARGGTGLGMLEVVVLAEEMGWLPMPGPWLSSSVAASLIATRLGDDAALPLLADGSLRATVAIEEGGHRDPLDGIQATARRRGPT